MLVHKMWEQSFTTYNNTNPVATDPTATVSQCKLSIPIHDNTILYIRYLMIYALKI